MDMRDPSFGRISHSGSMALLTYGELCSYMPEYDHIQMLYSYMKSYMKCEMVFYIYAYIHPISHNNISHIQRSYSLEQT